MQFSLPPVVSRAVLSGSAVAMGLLTASCKLPPRETWSRIQEKGLIPVLFDNPPGSPSGVNPAPVVATPARPAPASGEVLTVQAVRPAVETDRLPFATPVPGLPGYVFSPHTPGKKLIDARKHVAGTEVRCPYTLRAFLIPSFAPVPPVPAPAAPARPVAQLVSRQAPDVNSSPDPDGVPDLKIDTSTPTELPDAGQTPPEIPYGSRVPARPGFVHSPFAAKNQLVDVAGIAPGVEVKCPYTGKLFRVPELLPEELAPVPPTVIPPAPPVPGIPEEIPSLPQETPPPADPAPAVPGASPAPEAPAPPAGQGTANSDSPLPTAAWADREKHQVQSPFGSPGQLIDITGRAPGSRMQCPFTNREFIIPAP